MTVKHTHAIQGKSVAAGRDTIIQVLISAQEGPNFAMRKFSMQPGGGMPRHTNTVEHEQYVLRGQASITIGDETHQVQTGDVVFIPPGPDYPHQIINTSDAPLHYLSIGTKEAPEICEYPDSGKFLAQGRRDASTPFEVIDRRGPGLDYWDGEP